jgi:hypothetical protein
MVNVSLIMTVTQRESVTYLATNNPDFGRVWGRVICEPTP